MEKEYGFYGWQNADVQPLDDRYKDLKDPRQMYELLLGIWCRYSCSPRMREEWSEDNPTWGQCSTTSFLVQDIFGGRVYGVPLPEGGFHCYNEVDGHIFDLTSEQFGDQKLVYDLRNEQLREVHFANAEKKDRYEYLKAQFNHKLGID